MNDIVFLHDLVETNGKTIKENNLEIQHDIPLGTLIEVDCSCAEEHGTRMFIAAYGRDCDGEPLYSLTSKRNMCDDKISIDEYGHPRSEQYINTYRRLYHNGSWGKSSLIIVTSSQADASQQGYDEAINEVVAMAKLMPHLISPLFIPAIEGLIQTRKINRE